MSRINTYEKGKHFKLEVRDWKILEILAENSRMPISKIAKKIRLNRDSTNYRIERFFKEAIILRNTINCKYEHLQQKEFIVFFVMQNAKKKNELAAFLEIIKNHRHTKSVLEYSDSWDYEWHLICRDSTELAKITSKIFNTHASIIQERAVCEVVSNYHSLLLPQFFTKIDIPKEVPAPKIDEKDVMILTQLSKNSRMSTYELSKKIPLNADTIGKRIKKLDRQKTILRHTIIPNLSKLEYSWYTFAMQTKKFTHESESRLRTYVEKHPQIVRAVKTIGTYDVIIYIIAKSPKEFHTTVKEIKKTFKEEIKMYTSLIASEEHAYEPFPRCLHKL
jgi:DNA-binding Lrp family transcriptional regulator